MQVLIGGQTNLSGEGTLVEAFNLGTTTSVTVPAVGTFTGTTGTDGVAGAAAMETLGGGALATADIGSAIDGLFFTETWNNGGTGIRLTYTLPDTGDFIVEILHGEPRSCCQGTFSSVTFSDAGGTVPVPAFTIGNGIADQNPPADADWAIVRAKVRGVTQFVYNMPDGTGRGSSIVGFQVRRVTSTPTDTEPIIAEISAAGNTTSSGSIPGTSQALQFAQLAVFEPDPVTGRTVLNRTPGLRMAMSAVPISTRTAARSSKPVRSGISI